jgi:branched-chain amino acid transport system ATP-binding protein
MLEIKEIDGFYGASQALFGVCLEVREGEAVGLLGRNGMGKTTTVRAIMNLISVRSGSVTFGGREIRNMPPYRVAQLGVGLVPEGRQVFPNLTVHENLAATAHARSDTGENWTLDRVYELFPILEQRHGHMGNQLSGGEQQMLAIGRALMTNPRLLILDEATEGLAPLVRAEIWNCLRCLKEAGHAILVIDKHVRALCDVVDRHYIIEKGRIVWTGDSHELNESPAVRLRHLGI